MRPTIDEWGLALAWVTSRRATCLRRAVGCVLVDYRGRVLATGYNGVARGQPHCNEGDPVATYRDGTKTFTGEVCYPHACQGAHAPSGTRLDACQAIHAEQNALLQCPHPDQITRCYVTTAPCVTCVKLLLNTACERIIFSEPYAQPEAGDLWTAAGRLWEQQGRPAWLAAP